MYAFICPKRANDAYTKRCVSLKKLKTMFNSYGWVKLGMNRKHLDIMKEKIQLRYDKLDIELDKKVKNKLEQILSENEIIKYDFIGSLNNLESFLSIQHSRNHFSPRLRDFFKWITEVSDGSHGILYEIDNEDPNFDPDKPYRVWRLIGKEFEECVENIINEKYHNVNY